NFDAANEVGHEDEAVLEHADGVQRLAAVVLGYLPRQLLHPLGDLFGRQQNFKIGLFFSQFFFFSLFRQPQGGGQRVSIQRLPHSSETTSSIRTPSEPAAATASAATPHPRSQTMRCPAATTGQSSRSRPVILWVVSSSLIFFGPAECCG